MSFRCVPLTFGIDPISLKRKLALSLKKFPQKQQNRSYTSRVVCFYTYNYITNTTSILWNIENAVHTPQFIIMRSESSI